MTQRQIELLRKKIEAMENYKRYLEQQLEITSQQQRTIIHASKRPLTNPIVKNIMRMRNQFYQKLHRVNANIIEAKRKLIELTIKKEANHQVVSGSLNAPAASAA